MFATMMYLALTYDHRLLDGREAVTFLVKVRYNSSHSSIALRLIENRRCCWFKLGVNVCHGTCFSWDIEASPCRLICSSLDFDFNALYEDTSRVSLNGTYIRWYYLKQK